MATLPTSLPEHLTDAYGHTMTPHQYRAWDDAGRPEWPAVVRVDDRESDKHGQFIVKAYRAGYMNCSCRDCFEGPIIGVPGDVCDGCRDCTPGDHECSNPLAYGGEP
jgi:hypothetical protein